MRVNDITEQQLDEIPAGGIGQAMKGTASRFLNRLPSQAAKSKAANIAAQADVGETANLLHRDFNAYLGQQNKKMKQATGEDLAEFLKIKKHKTQQNIPQGVLQKQQLDQLLMAIAREAVSNPEASDDAPAKKKKKKKRSSNRNNDTSKQNQDDIQVAKKKVRNVEGGDRQMTRKMRRELDDSLRKFANGDENHGIHAAKKILKFANAGVDVSNVQQQWVASSKAHQRVLNQSVYYEITQMLKENGLSWRDIGLKIELAEDTNQYFNLVETY